MPAIHLDFRPKIGDKELYHLKDTLSRMGPYDELVVTMDTMDAHQSDRVAEQLTAYGFDYQPKGADGETYQLYARRRPN